MIQPPLLSDLRVLEYGQLVSAPYCSLLMGALGAEVLKVEPPRGDQARREGPFPGSVPHPEKSGLFLSMNLNKRGVTLDITRPLGHRVFKDLVKNTDVIVENSQPGFLAEAGLDYTSLKNINPHLIMVSITPFGQNGPYSCFKAGEFTLWHAGGWGFLWRERVSGEEPGLPVRPPAYMSGFQSAYNALTALLGALYFRDLSKESQHLDVSEQEAMTFIMAGSFPVYNEEKRILGKSSAIPNSVPSGPLPCKNGYVLLSAVEHHQFRGLAEIMGNPEWTRQEWTKSIQGRRLNWDVIDAFVREWLEDKDRDWVVEEAIKHRLPASPVGVSMKEILNDDHLKIREFFTEVEHPVAGRLKYPAPPCRFSTSPVACTRPAPLLGQHNEEVYCRELGYTVEDLMLMYHDGVI